MEAVAGFPLLAAVNVTAGSPGAPMVGAEMVLSGLHGAWTES